MREIKFRVWITDWGNSTSHLEYIKEGCLHVYFGNWERGGYKNAIFQQFTGLKDKNGREIYEGDILKEHHYEDWGDEEGFEYVGVVRHRSYSNDAGNQFSGFVTYPNLRENKGYAGNPIKVDCEVIGNIFENTDLLK
jgi:uncharacterized phage protein (TIGR01671 family)